MLEKFEEILKNFWENFETTRAEFTWSSTNVKVGTIFTYKPAVHVYKGIGGDIWN